MELLLSLTIAVAFMFVIFVVQLLSQQLLLLLLYSSSVQDSILYTTYSLVK